MKDDDDKLQQEEAEEENTACPFSGVVLKCEPVPGTIGNDNLTV
jgi:hypothetical protein